MKYIRFLAAIIFAMAATTVFAQVPQTTTKVLVIEGNRKASEASEDVTSMRLIPFNVPAGVTELDVKLDFSKGTKSYKEYSVGTGIFDSRGSGFGGPGYRGWQRTHLSDIVITGDQKTTSRFYIAGPIYPGEWNIWQWFRLSPKAGLHYKYTITFHFDGSAPSPTAPTPPVCDQGIINPAAGWYPGDLHFHTFRSDGVKELTETVGAHEKVGYRFLVSTDHNTTRAHYDFADTVKQHPKTLLIYGEEWTTAYGHANTIGLHPGSWADSRATKGDGKLPMVIDSIHKQGALFSINHPFVNKFQWLYADNEWAKADSIEVWNGTWTWDDQKSLDFWDSMLKNGRHIMAVGGTDNHNGVGPFCPSTWVYSRNLSKEAIMEALHKGHDFVSNSAKGPELILSSANGNILPGDTVKLTKNGTLPVNLHIIGGKGMTLRLIWSQSEEKIAISSDDMKINRTLKMTLTNRHGYIRAELRKPDRIMAALTNAIYVEK